MTSCSVSPAIRRIFWPTRSVAVDDADVGDDALVVVELGVEDQRPERRLRVARRGRHALDDRAEDVGHALPRLAADGEDLARVDPQASP